ncbi:hypothetical protein LTR08_004188 [Meristemomyces frigidus]|nr:hypothetical protein LTR08_004188 [Meristemomyces frigidus]
MLKTPPLQTATATIDTLSARLQSATLLEDRRAAILGLRSFAKQYPASVAGGSLKELIATLRRDGLGEAGSADSGSRDDTAHQSDQGGDVDTIRLVLETLLMLFNPDSSSPEASDEIALFMADGFSMRQDNITLLLSLLDPTSPFADYYSRLYSLQLLTAICAARPDRLQECVLSAPLGVSRLVGVLDDSRDAVRNAGLVLLVDLTSGANEDLRKIVAFEDVFGKVFALVRTEGGLAEAGITAQDCLSLLANLIKGSASNQTMFRESGCVLQMVKLLRDIFPPAETEVGFVAQQRERATWGLLQLLGLFLEPGEAGTAQNQAAFFRAGTSQLLIDLAFTAPLPTAIRTLTLKCAAALISSNPPLQEAFAQLTIALPTEAATTPSSTPQTNGARSAPSARGSARASAEGPRTYIIEALLSLTLTTLTADTAFRAAACNLIQAYLTAHERIKSHFLQRAIAGHADHEAAANVLVTLLQPGADVTSVVFAAWIVCDLIVEQAQAKAMLADVKEGDGNEGEDVLTAIQTLGSQLQMALEAQPADERLVAAYAGLLTVYLWEFADGVDDLLAEGSSLIQALLNAANPNAGNAVIAGLAATLLGTVYEFSTKDSPIPRRTLAPLLTQKLGRSKYLESLTQLRRHPAIRDFDLDDAGDEEVSVSEPFTNLFVLEFSRFRKAIDKDPGVEVLPLSAAEAGVDRDLLDDLREQVQATKDALAEAQQSGVAADQQAEQERMSATKDLQTARAEVDRVRRINQAMQQGHEAELGTLEAEHEKQRSVLGAEHLRVLAAVRVESETLVEVRLREQGAAAEEKVQKFERKIAELGNSLRTEQSAHAEKASLLDALTTRHADLSTRESEVRQRFDELTLQHREMSQALLFSKDQASASHRQFGIASDECEKRGGRVNGLETEVGELRDDLAGKEAELAHERAGFAELEGELEAVRGELRAVHESVRSDTAVASNAGSSEKIAALEKRVAEAKLGEEMAREELEGMLLVLEEIEAKRDGYRIKVKELGGEVSEDEEDDEDEEGDEDEENHEGDEEDHQGSEGDGSGGGDEKSEKDVD